VDYLTDYATAARYPGVCDAINKDDALRAIASAETVQRILNEVLK
jgi:hypothetical protein